MKLPGTSWWTIVPVILWYLINGLPQQTTPGIPRYPLGRPTEIDFDDPSEEDDSDDDNPPPWLPPRAGRVYAPMMGEYRSVEDGASDLGYGFQHPTEPNLMISATDYYKIYTRGISATDGTWDAGRYYIYSAFVDFNEFSTIYRTASYCWRVKGALSISDSGFVTGGRASVWLVRTTRTFDSDEIGDALSPSGHATAGYRDELQILATDCMYFRPPISTTYQTEIQIVPVDMVAVEGMDWNFLSSSGGTRVINEAPSDGSRYYFVLRADGLEYEENLEYRGTFYSYLWHSPFPFDATDGT